MHVIFNLFVIKVYRNRVLLCLGFLYLDFKVVSVMVERAAKPEFVAKAYSLCIKNSDQDFHIDIDML